MLPAGLCPLQAPGDSRVVVGGWRGSPLGLWEQRQGTRFLRLPPGPQNPEETQRRPCSPFLPPLTTFRQPRLPLHPPSTREISATEQDLPDACGCHQHRVPRATPTRRLEEGTTPTDRQGWGGLFRGMPSGPWACVGSGAQILIELVSPNHSPSSQRSSMSPGSWQLAD